MRRAGSKDLLDKLHFVPKLLAAVAVRGRAIVFLGDDVDFKAEPALTHSPGWVDSATKYMGEHKHKNVHPT